ncbi:MAG: ComEC/Rec2 family competence protein, partial [Oscillospiraceae bacterium]|nr:ComEC/Rec2 family competence protein [Oscillospiraceae bacterium]
MRKLMWFTIGFATACAVAVSVHMGMWGLLLAVLILGTSIALFTVKTVRCTVTSLILLGTASGFVWVFGYDALYLNTPRGVDGMSVESSIVISDYGDPTNSGSTADGYIKLEGKYYKIRISLTGKELLEPGDIVTGTALLKMTSGGREENISYLRGDGILLVGYMDEQINLEHGKIPAWLRLPAQLRKSIKETIDALFSEDAAGFARALVMGDTSALAYTHDVSMQISGIRHVVAVSGLHVSILFSFVYIAGGKRGIWTALFGIPLLVLFAAVAGFTPSVVRACVMQILMILSLLLHKEYDPPTALATAVLGILLFDPSMITSVSLQLSAGCIIGIFLFNQPIHDWFLRGKLKKLAKGKGVAAKVIRWTVSTVSVSLSTTIVTAPLVSYYFGAVSLVGVLTNLLTLWVISFVFYGIILTCVFNLFAVPLAVGIAWVVAWPIRYVLLISQLLSSLPLAAVYTCNVYIVLWLVMSYVLLAAFLKSKNKHPVIYASCVAVGLVLAVLAGRMEPAVMPIHTTVLDVGQGQCILLFSDSGTYMVDCGGDFGKSTANSAAQLLLSRGITRLDGMILTHYDADHAGGAEYFLSRFPVDRLYLPDIEDGGDIRSTLQQSYGSLTTWVSDKKLIESGNSKLWLYPSTEGKNENESSLSVLFQKENYDILITG